MADTFAFAAYLIAFPFHFGTYKLHGRNATAQKGFVSFSSQEQVRAIGAAWDAFVIKADVSGDAHPFCNNTKLKSITEIPVDIHLLDGGIRRDMRRHRTVSSFVRVIILIEVICFCKSL